MNYWRVTNITSEKWLLQCGKHVVWECMCESYLRSSLKTNSQHIFNFSDFDGEFYANLDEKFLETIRTVF